MGGVTDRPVAVAEVAAVGAAHVADQDPRSAGMVGGEIANHAEGRADQPVGAPAAPPAVRLVALDRVPADPGPPLRRQHHAALERARLRQPDGPRVPPLDLVRPWPLRPRGLGGDLQDRLGDRLDRSPGSRGPRRRRAALPRAIAALIASAVSTTPITRWAVRLHPSPYGWAGRSGPGAARCPLPAASLPLASSRCPKPRKRFAPRACGAPTASAGCCATSTWSSSRDERWP